MSRLVSLAARGLLRLVAALVLMAGIGAMAAAAVAIPLASRLEEPRLRELTWFCITISLACLVSAISSLRLLPAAGALHRLRSGSSVPLFQFLLFAALALAAMLQMPALLNWWREDRALLQPVMLHPDPLGLNLVPSVLLYWLPAFATALWVVCLATSAGAALAPRPVSRRLLAAGVALQSGLLLAEFVALSGGQWLAGTAARALEGAPPDARAALAAWIGRHDRAAHAAIPALAAIVGGYIIALVVAYAWPGEDAAEVHDVESSPLPARGPARAAPPVASAAAAAFDDSSYVLRARAGLLGLFARRFISYDLQTIPPRSRSRFSFSWATGAVRREPAGPDVLYVKPAEFLSLFVRAYSVTDGATGALIGRLVPRDADWEILDAHGGIAALVLERWASFERMEHMVTVAGADMCRLTWLRGLTAVSAEVEIEFLAAADRRLDRAWPVALAPILEDRARRARRTSA